MSVNSKFIAEMASTEGRSKVTFELFTYEKKLLANIIIHYVSYEALFGQNPKQSYCKIENLYLRDKFFELQNIMDFREDYSGGFDMEIADGEESSCRISLEERDDNFRFGLSKWVFVIEINLCGQAEHNFSMIVDQSCVENFRQQIADMSGTEIALT